MSDELGLEVYFYRTMVHLACTYCSVQGTHFGIQYLLLTLCLGITFGDAQSGVGSLQDKLLTPVLPLQSLIFKNAIF